jgi:hypothetical protein
MCTIKAGKADQLNLITLHHHPTALSSQEGALSSRTIKMNNVSVKTMYMWGVIVTCLG